MPDLGGSIPLVVAVVALFGVALTSWFQQRNVARQIKATNLISLAEMRQNWLNSLRDNMAKFQSYGITPTLDHQNICEFYESRTKIELLMNPNGIDFEELHNCLYEFLGAQSIEEKYAANPQYINVCQRIIKREWEMLKLEKMAASR